MTWVRQASVAPSRSRRAWLWVAILFNAMSVSWNIAAIIAWSPLGWPVVGRLIAIALACYLIRRCHKELDFESGGHSTVGGGPS